MSEGAENRIATAARVTVVAGGAIWLLHAGREIFAPVALSILIWFLINALADALRSAPAVGRRMGVGASKAIAALAFLALALFVGQVMVDNMVSIGAHIDPAQSPLLAATLDLAARLGLPAEFSLEALSEIYPFQGMIGAAFTVIRNLISDLSFVLLYVLFLLLDEPHFDAKLRALAPDEERRARLRAVLGDIAEEARVYIWLMFLVSSGVGLATFALCAAFGVPGAAFWGFLAFGLNFIPTIGSILGVAIPSFYALLTFSDPAPLIALVTLLSAVQFTAGNVILPRLMGDRLNMATFFVLFALVVWGALWGPVGMFLGIPITVIGLLICSHFESARPVAILLSRDGRLRAGEASRD